MGISAAVTGVGGWTVGPVVGRRPAGAARDAVHPGTGARAVLVIVDGRFTGRGLPDPETVARAAIVGSPAVMPMLDAGLLEDGTRWYVTPASPGPVLDPAAGCSPRRAATIVEAVARALAAVHAAGLVHGLVGAQAVVPAAGRHGDRPVGTTLLLDTGVAALLGDRAGDLAAAAGVSLPADRGPEADVHALGALLLRLLTAAAPVGPALAALPVGLRALLSAMLDEHPGRRPTADAVARTLAELREELLGTTPVPIQAPAPAVGAGRPRTAPTPAPLRGPAPAVVPTAITAPSAPSRASAPPVAPAPRVASAPGAAVAVRPIVPPPIPAPHTLESPIVVPRSSPDVAPSLWTGSVPIVTAVGRPRRRGRRIMMLAGGVGLAGLLVGVATHLPLGRVDGDQAAAAVAEHGLLAGPSASTSGPAAAITAATKAKPSHAAIAGPGGAPAAVAPSFVRPTSAVPSPLAASATATTPSRNTAPATGATPSGPSSVPTRAPSSSSSSGASSGSPASSDPAAPSGTATSGASVPPSTGDTSSTAPAGGSTPAGTTPTVAPTTPADTTTPPDQNSGSPSSTDTTPATTPPTTG